MKKYLTKCLIDNCNRESYSKDLCIIHYRRKEKGIDLNKPLRSSTKERRKCKIENCNYEEYIIKHQLCRSHYKRLKKGQDLNIPLQRQYEGKLCKVESCQKLAKSQSYCHNHYIQIKRKTRLLKIIELKGGKCKICGNSFHPGAYEFHHRDPENKEFNIGNIILNEFSEVLKELEKCDLVCANCHGIHHYNEKQKDIENEKILHNFSKRRGNFL